MSFLCVCIYDVILHAQRGTNVFANSSEVYDTYLCSNLSQSRLWTFQNGILKYFYALNKQPQQKKTAEQSANPIWQIGRIT